MFLAVWFVIKHDLRHIANRVDRVGVDGHIAERCLKRFYCRGGDALEGHAMGGTDQHDPLDALRFPAPGGIGIGRHLAGIDIAGMGCDQGFRRDGRRYRRGGEIARDIGSEGLALRWIEEARDRGVPHIAHGLGSFLRAADAFELKRVIAFDDDSRALVELSAMTVRLLKRDGSGSFRETIKFDADNPNTEARLIFDNAAFGIATHNGRGAGGNQ